MELPAYRQKERGKDLKKKKKNRRTKLNHPGLVGLIHLGWMLKEKRIKRCSLKQ